MGQDSRCSEALRRSILQRIADALEIPASALHGTDPVRADGAGATARSEVAAVLSAFMQIRDPAQRRACLDYVIAVADEGERPRDP